MKRMLMGLLALSLFASCSNNEQFILNGKVENAGDLKKVLLYEGDQVVDSAFLNENDNFRFKRTALEARPYTLVVANRSYMLVLMNGDNVEFATDLNGNEDQYSVQGSEISSRLQKLSSIRAAFQKSQLDIQSEFERRILSEDESTVHDELTKKNDAIIDENLKQTYAFAQENRDNLAGFYAMLSLFSLDPVKYEKELISYADEARVKFPDNSAVQSFANHMAELKPVSIGQKAPDFESLSPTGRKIKLSDFKGKYVLLDFWASWCAPCRVENPNIVKQYNTFKDKGFTVLGVSLDDNQTAWLKAIKDDNLDWSQVSELKRWDSETGQLYKITAIPASFLIDPDGVIIGKNLHGLDLENALAERLQ